jgi:hypothetical protein
MRQLMKSELLLAVPRQLVLMMLQRMLRPLLAHSQLKLWLPFDTGQRKLWARLRCSEEACQTQENS